jgi:hypothetical protein
MFDLWSSDMSCSTLTLVLLALASLAASAPTSTGQVFSIKAKSHRLTAEQAVTFNKKRADANPSLRHFFESEGPAVHLQDAASQTTVNLKDYYQFALIGQVSAGTPAQNFSVMFDLWSSDMSVVDVNAVFDTEYCDSDSGCDDQNTALAAKNAYNASASSTSSTSTKKFRGSFEPGDKGTVTKDTVTIGGISTTLSFGDLTQVGNFLDWLPVDGTVGLSAVKSTNKISNVLTQLVPSLTSPVITIHVNRSFIDNSAWAASDAEIMFGSNALPQCNANNWATISLASKIQVELGNANATSVSITDTSTVNGVCNNAVTQTSHPFIVVDGFNMLHVSVQAMEVLKKATGATFNTGVKWYTVDCTQLDSIPTVSIGLSDGNSIVLSARDYVVDLSMTKYNVCVLWAYGDYDEGALFYQAVPIPLGQLWLNRHCISYDISANTLSYTDALPNNGQ